MLHVIGRAEQTQCCACTHIVVSDVVIVLSELPQPDRETLHESAALVVARRTAPNFAEEKREDQGAQEERPRSHDGDQAAEVFWRQRSDDAAGLMDVELYW